MGFLGRAGPARPDSGRRASSTTASRCSSSPGRPGATHFRYSSPGAANDVESARAGSPTIRIVPPSVCQPPPTRTAGSSARVVPPPPPASPARALPGARGRARRRPAPPPPAVTIVLWAARRFDNVRDLFAYLAAQVVGGLLAGACLWGLAKSAKGAGSMVGNLSLIHI